MKVIFKVLGCLIVFTAVFIMPEKAKAADVSSACLKIPISATTTAQGYMVSGNKCAQPNSPCWADAQGKKCTDFSVFHSSRTKCEGIIVKDCACLTPAEKAARINQFNKFLNECKK